MVARIFIRPADRQFHGQSLGGAPVALCCGLIKATLFAEFLQRVRDDVLAVDRIDLLLDEFAVLAVGLKFEFLIFI